MARNEREDAIIESYRRGDTFHEIEHEFGLPWAGAGSLTDTLEANDDPMRKGRPDDPEHIARQRTPRHRCFKPYTTEELIALYQRVRGKDWDPALIGLKDQPVANAAD